MNQIDQEKDYMYAELVEATEEAKEKATLALSVAQ